MSNGDQALDDFVRSLRALGHVDADAARLAAPLVEAAVKRTAAAGTDPDGKPWLPKKDGGRALEHAADHVTAKAVGTTVVVTLVGPDVLHNSGTKRVPKRQIIPDGGAGIPKSVTAALTEGAARAFEKTMGAR
jgi:hypothetical protein